MFRVKTLVLSFVMVLITLWVASSALAQDSDNCGIRDNAMVCEFTKENSPACHNTGEFPTPQSVADFYGGKIIQALPSQNPDGTIEWLTLVHTDTPKGFKRYLLQGTMPGVGIDFDLCIVAIVTELQGDPT